MVTEIERKYLVVECGFLVGRRGEDILQGYLAKESGGVTSRVRIRGDRAYLTLKGPRTRLSRPEFEYEIPLADARDLLDCCGDRLIRKTRYCVPFGGHVFEVDVFQGAHEGLIVAEVELQSESERIQLPHWIGAEVTFDRRYGNFALAQQGAPFVPTERSAPESSPRPPEPMPFLRDRSPRIDFPKTGR